jgi:hypothetical protein
MEHSWMILLTAKGPSKRFVPFYVVAALYERGEMGLDEGEYLTKIK